VFYKKKLIDAEMRACSELKNANDVILVSWQSCNVGKLRQSRNLNRANFKSPMPEQEQASNVRIWPFFLYIKVTDLGVQRAYPRQRKNPWPFTPR
jgi:hypothetical protein